MAGGVRLALMLVRAWTHVYTCGLAQELKEERRAEIDSDLWESCHDRDRADRSDFALQILARLALGVPDDLTWRAAHVAPRACVKVVGLTATAAAIVAAVWVLDVLRAEELPQPPAIRRMIRLSPPPPPPPPPPPIPLPSSMRGRS